MDDPERGTGRTTRMLFDAYMLARTGKTVHLLFETPKTVRAIMHTYWQLFVKGANVPQHNYFNVCQGRVYFHTVTDDPAELRGVVLADHTVTSAVAQSMPDLANSYASWASVPEEAAA